MVYSLGLFCEFLSEPTSVPTVPSWHIFSELGTFGLAHGWEKSQIRTRKQIRSSRFTLHVSRFTFYAPQSMSESYIQNLFAERIGGSQYGKSQALYKFEKIKRAKRTVLALQPGAEIIDL